MTSYLYQSPSGVPGDVTRVDESNVEPAMLITPFPTNYGVPMKNVAGGITPMGTGDTAALFAGILARAVPGISQSSVNEQVDQFTPNQSEPQGLCVRGYIGVQVNSAGGTPVRGAPVYLVVVASTGHPLGSLEASANGSNNVALTGTQVGNVTFATDGVDPYGFAEIRIAQ